ncbi:wd domain-containing protein [Cyclospora cayetanensis]|uniref:Wd domain-containing protein n=1 Tax=Cyclospora cayetanensis TaxID=88456 RepID=A0A1D3CVX2_9EIME|nr:wd domain-containing protein [Cyclospora cayetanensis]
MAVLTVFFQRQQGKRSEASAALRRAGIPFQQQKQLLTGSQSISDTTAAAENDCGATFQPRLAAALQLPSSRVSVLRLFTSRRFWEYERLATAAATSVKIWVVHAHLPHEVAAATKNAKRQGVSPLPAASAVSSVSTPLASSQSASQLSKTRGRKSTAKAAAVDGVSSSETLAGAPTAKSAAAAAKKKSKDVPAGAAKNFSCLCPFLRLSHLPPPDRLLLGHEIEQQQLDCDAALEATVYMERWKLVKTLKTPQSSLPQVFDFAWSSDKRFIVAGGARGRGAACAAWLPPSEYCRFVRDARVLRQTSSKKLYMWRCEPPAAGETSWIVEEAMHHEVPQTLQSCAFLRFAFLTAYWQFLTHKGMTRLWVGGFFRGKKGGVVMMVVQKDSLRCAFAVDEKGFKEPKAPLLFYGHQAPVKCVSFGDGMFISSKKGKRTERHVMYCQGAAAGYGWLSLAVEVL